MTHASYIKFMYIARAITHNKCVSDHKELLALTCGTATSALNAYTTSDIFHYVPQ